MGFVNNIYLVKLTIINSNQFRATEFGCAEAVYLSLHFIMQIK